jgi:hypothetical protein
VSWVEVDPQVPREAFTFGCYVRIIMRAISSTKCTAQYGFTKMILLVVTTQETNAFNVQLYSSAMENRPKTVIMFNALIITF